MTALSILLIRYSFCAFSPSSRFHSKKGSPSTVNPLALKHPFLHLIYLLQQIRPSSQLSRQCHIPSYQTISLTPQKQKSTSVPLISTFLLNLYPKSESSRPTLYSVWDGFGFGWVAIQAGAVEIGSWRYFWNLWVEGGIGDLKFGNSEIEVRKSGVQKFEITPWLNREQFVSERVPAFFSQPSRSLSSSSLCFSNIYGQQTSEDAPILAILFRLASSIIDLTRVNSFGLPFSQGSYRSLLITSSMASKSLSPALPTSSET